jgi:hypothetical protein
VIADNLGHAGTVTTTKHYAHFAPSFAVDAIRRGAPKYGIKPDERVVRLSRRK